MWFFLKLKKKVSFVSVCVVVLPVNFHSPIFGSFWLSGWQVRCLRPVRASHLPIVIDSRLIVSFFFSPFVPSSFHRRSAFVPRLRFSYPWNERRTTKTEAFSFRKRSAVEVGPPWCGPNQFDNWTCLHCQNGGTASYRIGFR